MQLSDKILNKIKENKIAPKAKYIFVFKNIVFWFLFIFSLAIGSIASSVMIWVIKTSDWDLQKHIDKNIFGFALKTFPYLWFAVLLVFMGVAYLNFSHTKNGYRYHYYLIVLVSIISSIILGGVLSLVEFGSKVENTLINRVPVYHKMVEKNSMIWQRPEAGMLAGKILIIQDNNKFVLVDLESKEWNIICENCIKIGKPLKPGIRIKIIGEPLSHQDFIARIIKHWYGQGCHLLGNNGSCMMP